MAESRRWTKNGSKCEFQRRNKNEKKRCTKQTCTAETHKKFAIKMKKYQMGLQKKWTKRLLFAGCSGHACKTYSLKTKHT